MSKLSEVRIVLRASSNQTKINVRVDWNSFKVKRTHLVLEENEDLVKSTQEMYGIR